MKKTTTLFLLIILLTSCYKQTVTIKNNKTGTVAYSVNINSGFTNYLSSLFDLKSSFNKNFFINYNETEIESIIEQIKDIKLRKNTITNSNDGRIYNIEIQFNDIEKIPDIMPQKYFRNRIYEESKIIYIKTNVTAEFLGNINNLRKELEKLSENEKNYIYSYIEAIKYQFTYNCQNTIFRTVCYKKGETSPDNKSVTYSFSLKEIVDQTVPIEITVSFRK